MSRKVAAADAGEETGWFEFSASAVGLSGVDVASQCACKRFGVHAQLVLPSSSQSYRPLVVVPRKSERAELGIRVAYVRSCHKLK